ncbi:phospholipase [Pseudomonas sp. P5_152]|uniref:phospholipase n=1 Tax=Pseudomonas sp. P5_152 TaxID=3043442 RepID=UPI002A35C8EA|nr:phospholipase [Pseudomonas sp. P5_152]MDX9668480.1 phospholipase [Pseudomonas sp. P5_152]
MNITHTAKISFRHEWMSKTPSMDGLTLNQLVWPGAHNSGMDLYTANHNTINSVLASHTMCQNGPYIQQLNSGARALDLRVFSNSRKTDIYQFETFHGPATGSPLSDLVKALDFFLDKNPDEFILLDVHQTEGSQGNGFAFKEFNDAINRRLGERLIPFENRHLTLAELKAISRTQRVVIAASGHPEFDARVFWPKILHCWSGKDLTSPSELKQHIARTLDNPPDGSLPWSLSATSYILFDASGISLIDPLYGANNAFVRVNKITDELNEWFSPSPTGEWLLKCSIINVDFIDETLLVEYCREANMYKARKK